MTGTVSTRPVSCLDHLVIVADNLEQGVAWCEATLGVVPGPGGRHGLMATHNRLLKIGSPQSPDAYLEIIAIDPSAGDPLDGRARWFGMDDPVLRSAVRSQPQLVHFVAQTGNLVSACAALALVGEDVGRPVSASRPTPQGDLHWQITLRDDGVPQHGGGLPALIQWQGRHPAASMPDAGVHLLELSVQSVDPSTLQRAWVAIGLSGVEMKSAAPAPRLQARLMTPRGVVTLGDDSIRLAVSGRR